MYSTDSSAGGTPIRFAVVGSIRDKRGGCDLESAHRAVYREIATWNFPRGIASSRPVRRCRSLGLSAKWAKCDPHARVVVVVIVISEGDAFEVAVDEQRALPVGARIRERRLAGFAVVNTIESIIAGKTRSISR